MAKAPGPSGAVNSDQAAESDRALGPQVPAGQQAPLEMPTLVAEHHAAVYRYARRLCGCASEAEDLTQQTFLLAQEKLGQLRDAARAAGWLMAITRNCFLKDRRRRQPAAAEACGLVVDHVPDRTPAVDEIDREALEQALGELAAEFRVVLLMFYFEELSYQEIAAQLDLPVGTVMSRLSRAKGHLRTKLAPPDVEPAMPAPRRSSTASTRPIPVKAAR